MGMSQSENRNWRGMKRFGQGAVFSRNMAPPSPRYPPPDFSAFRRHFVDKRSPIENRTQNSAFPWASVSRTAAAVGGSPWRLRRPIRQKQGMARYNNNSAPQRVQKTCFPRFAKMAYPNIIRNRWPVAFVGAKGVAAICKWRKSR